MIKDLTIQFEDGLAAVINALKEHGMLELNKDNESNMTRGKAILVIIIWFVIYIDLVYKMQKDIQI